MIVYHSPPSGRVIPQCQYYQQKTRQITALDNCQAHARIK